MTAQPTIATGPAAAGAAGGAAHRSGLRRCGCGRLGHCGRLGLLGCERADLDPDCLELALQLLRLVVGQIVLESERLELRRLEEATLLGALDEGARRLRL